MERTREQMRRSALAAARSVLRDMGKVPETASVRDACTALEVYARWYPAMEESVWYRLATLEEMDVFCQEWRDWQGRMRSLVRVPNCVIFTPDDVTWAAVYVLPGGVEGRVMMDDEEISVYVLDRLQQRYWSTSQQEAVSFAARVSGFDKGVVKRMTARRDERKGVN